MGIEKKILKQIAEDKEKKELNDVEFITSYINLVNMQINEIEKQINIMNGEIETAKIVRKNLVSILRKIRSK